MLRKSVKQKKQLTSLYAAATLLNRNINDSDVRQQLQIAREALEKAIKLTERKREIEESLKKANKRRVMK